MKDQYIDGHKIEYEDDSREGIRFLEKISRDSADVFFHYAQCRRKPALFEHDRDEYMLAYKGSDVFMLSVKD